MTSETSNIPASHEPEKKHAGNLIRHSVIQCCSRSQPDVLLIPCMATLTDVKEGWSVSIKTNDENTDGTDEKETHELSFSFPNGQIWTGSINDLQAAFATMQNTLNFLDGNKNADSRYEVAGEVRHALKHLNFPSTPY